MDKRKISFTAANSLPLKICIKSELIKDLRQKYIPPVHAQVIPTNRCNLSCSFCSCGKRNKKQELAFMQLRRLADDLEEMGCEAVTITGGGEPLLHQDIYDIIQMFCEHNLQVGFVTNGLLLKRAPAGIFNSVTWCRISCSDERVFQKDFPWLDEVIAESPGVDWAFSYVLSTRDKFKPDNLRDYVEFGNKHNFTHIRVVSDLMDLRGTVDMLVVKTKLAGIDDSKVIYQGRKEYELGQENCYISLLKPVIAADGFVYPCCGAQYALERDVLDMPPSMRMCKIEDIQKLYKYQRWFDGSVCVRCYYKAYNDLLGVLTGPIKHEEFV